MTKLAAGISTFSLLCFASCLEGVPSGETRPQVSEPKVIEEQGEKQLQLPEALLKKVRQEFPEYRVPSKEDKRGEWSKDWLFGPFPYAAWGDFDGDSLTDIALILIGEGKWKLVIFQQTKGEGYTSGDIYGVLKDDPWGETLSVLKRGTEKKKYGFNEETGETELVGTFKFDIDVVVLNSEEASTGWLWNGREFERVHLRSYE